MRGAEVSGCMRRVRRQMWWYNKFRRQRKSSWYFSGSILIGVQESIRRLNEDEVFHSQDESFCSTKRILSLSLQKHATQLLVPVHVFVVGVQRLLLPAPRVANVDWIKCQQQLTHWDQTERVLSQSVLFAATRATCRSAHHLFFPAFSHNRQNKLLTQESWEIRDHFSGKQDRNYLSRCACSCCGRSWSRLLFGTRAESHPSHNDLRSHEQIELVPASKKGKRLGIAMRWSVWEFGCQN